jgi:Lon protease-like protein
MPKLELTIPEQAPVMVLPNALLFPNALMPLYIFEPRYRAMLQWALEHDRVFCIALRKPDAPETRTPDDFFHTAGLGLVRACVGRDDGTSHLMLQGLVRVRLSDFTKRKPFFIGRLEPLLPIHPKPERKEEAHDLARQVREICARFKESGVTVPEGVGEYLAKMDDPDILADSVAHAFLRDPLRRQELLETVDVRERLEKLAAHLRSELQV